MIPAFLATKENTSKVCVLKATKAIGIFMLCSHEITANLKKSLQ